MRRSLFVYKLESHQIYLRKVCLCVRVCIQTCVFVCTFVYKGECACARLYTKVCVHVLVKVCVRVLVHERRSMCPDIQPSI